MFPLRDDNPTARTSLVTFLIIGLNAAAWVFVQGMGFDEVALARSVCELGAIPGELLGTVAPGTAVPVGPNAACVLDADPDVYTLFTHMFLHGSWMHIIGNMWFLAVFGDNVEDAMGHVRFAIFYLLCGLAAVFAQMLSSPASPIPMVGASGAIGGVMGAYAVLYPRARVHMLVIFGFWIDRIVVPAALMLGYWFLIQLVLGLGSIGGSEGAVAFWAHAGGFLAGIVLSFVFRDPERLAAHRRAMMRHWGVYW